jgi:hypothetical protein
MTTKAVLDASSLSKGCVRPTRATTCAMISSGMEHLCIGSYRMCEPHHTLLFDTRHNLKTLQYDSTRFASYVLGQESHEPKSDDRFSRDSTHFGFNCRRKR